MISRQLSFLSVILLIAFSCSSSNRSIPRNGPISRFVSLSSEFLTDSVKTLLSDSLELGKYKINESVGKSGSFRMTLEHEERIYGVSKDSVSYYPTRVILLKKWVFVFFDMGKAPDGNRILWMDEGMYASLLTVGNPLTGEIIRIEYGGHRLCNRFFGQYEETLYSGGAWEWYLFNNHNREPLTHFLQRADSVYLSEHNYIPIDEIKLEEVSCESLVLSSLLD